MMGQFISHLIIENINYVWMLKMFIPAATRLWFMTARNDGGEACGAEVGDTLMNQFHIQFS